MTRAQIIKAVQARMNDLLPGTQIEVGSSPFVDALLDSCVENFYLMMPVHVLPATDFSSNTVVTVDSDEVKVNRIQLPEDFIKLISFRCEDWNRAASKALAEGTQQHYKQYHAWTFGGNSRPEVAIVVDTTYGRCIEYYNYNSTTASTTITLALCAVKGDVEDIPDNLIDAFAWYVASVTFQSMNEMDSSKAALEKVQQYIILHQ